MINRSVLAEKVAAVEGKKVQVNIAQIKEVLKCTLRLLAQESEEDVLVLLRKVSREAERRGG